ncbi:uncharacterized protein isoform X1 [Rhodnius prolixus]|uniref:uncharacterized protein isoform X1 n=1 Tax=Rhodnius prolixus TaxID=13249 RepID=UPI003D18B0F9
MSLVIGLQKGDSDAARFTINGTVYLVNGDSVPADTSLNTFIRDFALLKGTKYMCKEGGCGVCIVSVQSEHPVTKQTQHLAVNSCLLPVFSCHGKAITTIEGIGSKKKGYHKLQTTLAQFYGTQCGFCSPAMIMNMYSLLQENPNITMREVEDSFGGNICRCTGYRPILDAFKALASDTTKDLREKCKDIEDAMKSCHRSGKSCSWKCSNCKRKTGNLEQTEDNTNHEMDFVELALAPKKLQINLKENNRWYRVTSIREIMEVFDLISSSSYILVNGNTAQGVYRLPEPPTIYIDISDVTELKSYTVTNEHLELGANITLAECIKLFRTLSAQNALLCGYTGVLADHIEMVANVPVRNVGTLAGNLSIKHQHLDFPSDIFLIFLTVGAQITIHNKTGINNTVPLLEYLQLDMNFKVISSIRLPALSSKHYRLETFKIMPRKQNVHALVNAGFLFRINNDNYLVEERPVIVYGNISKTFTHAYNTESYLTGKPLTNQETLKNALKILSKEIDPEKCPLKASPEYRRTLAVSLFYRFVLSVNPEQVNERYRTGCNNLQRPLSSGKQEYVTNKAEWPLTQPMPKMESLIQCSGEAEYLDDKPKCPNELYGALVLADKANGVISKIDASTALKMPGIIAFYNADHIPGQNTFIQPPTSYNYNLEFEEIFCSGKTLCAGQPVGIVVAISQELAIKASRCVKIEYASVEKPLITVQDVLDAGDQSRIILKHVIEPTETKQDVKHHIKGEYHLEGQYHYNMEVQNCLCIPTDEGMTIHASAQWLSALQFGVALALNMPANKIQVKVKRIGGAFGGKLSRNIMVAAAGAVAAYNLNQPVRVVLDLTTNMRAIGKRYPLLAKYDLGVNDDGLVQNLKLDIYENSGYSENDDITEITEKGIPSIYDITSWKVNIYLVKTDIPCTTWMRAPGMLEGITTADHIMEHIAFIVKKDPVEICRLNCNPDDRSVFDEMLQTIKTSSDYVNRRALVDQFNKDNRWKKKGISLVPMKFTIKLFPNFYSLVSIYAGDGTVAISSGGVEMGQGLNTKVAQVAAHTLGIDLDMVKIDPTICIISPNSYGTAASSGSEIISYATLRACEQIMNRLQPLKEKMGNPTWLELVQNAVNQGVSLSEQFMYTTADPSLQPYPIYGFVVLETEVDLLTGQYQILRADILEDVGESMSPFIDIGQIEGAFVMGLGYFHSEELIYDKDDGRLLTDRTWTYWPPGAQDIPIDFRITMRRNAPNPKFVLRSKGTGEPALCLSVSLQHALKMAISSARKDAGLPAEWFELRQPCTFEKVLLAVATDPKDFSIQ